MNMGVMVLATKPSKTTLHVVGGIAGATLFGSFLYSIVAGASIPSSPSPVQKQLTSVDQKLYSLEKSSYQLNAQIAKLDQQLSGVPASAANVNIAVPKVSLPPAVQTVTSASGVVY